MQLRKSITRPARLEDDDDYSEAAPQPKVKPRLPALMRAHAVPFKLQPAAFPSLPLTGISDAAAEHGEALPTSSLEPRSNDDLSDVAKFDDIDQSGFATKIDWQNSNNLHQGFFVPDDRDLTWSDLGIATQLVIWSKFRENTKATMAADLLGLTAEQYRVIESLQCMSEIFPLREKNIHKEIDREYRQGVKAYNKPHTHSSIAEKHLDDLTLEGHLRHPYEYEIEKGKNFLRERGLTELLVDPKNARKNKREVTARPRRPTKLKTTLLDSSHDDSGYDSGLPAKEHSVSKASLPSPGTKRSAEDAFRAPVLVGSAQSRVRTKFVFRRDGFAARNPFWASNASLAPPSPIIRAVQGATADLDTYMVQPATANQRSRKSRPGELPLLVPDVPTSQLSEDNFVDPRKLSAPKDSMFGPSTPEPRRNQARGARWNTEAWKALKTTEETYNWNRGGAGDADELALPQETDNDYVNNGSPGRPIHRSRDTFKETDPKLPTSSATKAVPSSRRSLILKIKKQDGTAVLRKERVIDETKSYRQYQVATTAGQDSLPLQELSARDPVQSKEKPRFALGSEKSKVSIAPPYADGIPASSSVPGRSAGVTSKSHESEIAGQTHSSEEFSDTELPAVDLMPLSKTAEANSSGIQVLPYPGVLTPLTTSIMRQAELPGKAPRDYNSNEAQASLTEMSNEQDPCDDGQPVLLSTPLEQSEPIVARSADRSEPPECLRSLIQALSNSPDSPPMAPPYSPITDTSSPSRRGSELSEHFISEAQPLALRRTDGNITIPNSSELVRQHDPLQNAAVNNESLAVWNKSDHNVQNLQLRFSKAKRFEDLVATPKLESRSSIPQSSVEDLEILAVDDNVLPEISVFGKPDESTSQASPQPDPQMHPLASQETEGTPFGLQATGKTAEELGVELSKALPQEVQFAKRQVLEAFNASKQAIDTAAKALNAGANVTIKSEVNQSTDQEQQGPRPTAQQKTPTKLKSQAKAMSKATSKANSAPTRKSETATQSKKRKTSAGPKNSVMGQRVDAGKKRAPYNTKRRREEAERLKKEAAGKASKQTMDGGRDSQTQ